MALTFDNARYTQNGNQDTSLTFTCAANAVLFAVYDANNGGAIISAGAVSYGGVLMNSVAGAQTFSLYTWVCSAPPAGVNTFHMRCTGLFQKAVALISYTGAPTATQYGTPNAASSGTASNYNVSVSSTNTDLVITFIRAENGTNVAFVNNGTTRLSGTNSGSSRLLVAEIGGAGSITISATVQTAATSWQSIAIPLHAAATPSTLRVKMMLDCGA